MLKIGSMTKSRAFSLIEVLVSIIVLGVSVLGVATMISQSAKNINSQNGLAIAMHLSEDMMGRMKSNMLSVNQNNYLNFNIDLLPAQQTCLVVGCTPLQIADYDKREWGLSVIRRLAEPKAKLILVGDLIQLHLVWKSAGRPFKASGCDYALQAEESCVVQGLYIQ